jgi:hypothetical protein
VKRLIWAKTDVSTSKDGKQTFAYPFLLDSNVMEKCYLQHMIALKPFAATYGNLETEWADMVQDINSKVGDDGKPIFSPPLVVRTAKDRLKDYVKFANSEHSHILNSTGCDNMPTRSEIQVLLVDLLEIYNAHRDKEREAKATYASKKRDRIEGELARSDHLASYEHHMKENGRGSSEDTVASKKQQRSAPPPPTAGMEVMMDKKNVMEGRRLDFVEKQHDDKKEILTQYLSLQARRCDAQDKKDNNMMMMIMEQNRMMLEIINKKNEI